MNLLSHKVDVDSLYLQVELIFCVPLPQDTEQVVNSLHVDQVGQSCILQE